MEKMDMESSPEFAMAARSGAETDTYRSTPSGFLPAGTLVTRNGDDCAAAPNEKISAISAA
jgi:hypothetical protein